jgi:hypothetical protein
MTQANEHIAEAVARAEAHNPLMDRLSLIPGETVRLPSLGKFYDNNVLINSENGEIEILPMTMTDEVLMKSPDMLLQGTAIEYVVKRCCPQVVSPLDLLVGDLDFVLTHLRRISLGSKIELTFKCSNTTCNHEQNVDIPLDYFLNDSPEIDMAKFNETYTYITEADGRTVNLSPLKFRDYLNLLKANDTIGDDLQAYTRFLQDTFMSIIMSVDEIKDREMIREWINRLPLKDSKKIMAKSKNLQNFGPKFKFVASCSRCKHKNDLSTDINPTAFFIEPSNQENLI